MADFPNPYISLTLIRRLKMKFIAILALMFTISCGQDTEKKEPSSSNSQSAASPSAAKSSPEKGAKLL